MSIYIRNTKSQNRARLSRSGEREEEHTEFDTERNRIGARANLRESSEGCSAIAEWSIVRGRSTAKGWKFPPFWGREKRANIYQTSKTKASDKQRTVMCLPQGWRSRGKWRLLRGRDLRRGRRGEWARKVREGCEKEKSEIYGEAFSFVNGYLVDR